MLSKAKQYFPHNSSSHANNIYATPIHLHQDPNLIYTYLPLKYLYLNLNKKASQTETLAILHFIIHPSKILSNTNY
jgi:hypothetical protein